MAEVKFLFNGGQTIIQCCIKDKLKDIIKKFYEKSQIKDDNNLYFLYNGNTIDNELTFQECINQVDKEKNKMIILVEEESRSILKINNKKYKSEEIICPKCNENISLTIDDYKIKLFDCKNGHKFENILLTDFENTQLIDPANTLCNNCKQKNIINAFKNEIYM